MISGKVALDTQLNSYMKSYINTYIDELTTRHVPMEMQLYAYIIQLLLQKGQREKESLKLRTFPYPNLFNRITNYYFTATTDALQFQKVLQ